MGGFFGWFLVFIGVLAIFNAEKLPALRQMLEEKFKGSLDMAKEVSKNTKTKIEKVKTEIDNKKNVPQTQAESEENTPEETAEALQFMSNYINTENKPQEESSEQPAENIPAETTTEDSVKAEKTEDDADKPIDLNHFD